MTAPPAMLKVTEKLLWLMLIKRNMGVVVAQAERTRPLLFPRCGKVLIQLSSEPEPLDKKR